MIIQMRYYFTGYIFNYATNLPDSDGALPIPETLSPVIDRICQKNIGGTTTIDQITINE